MRSCTVCAPLRENRRLKKAQRKADAQAQAHSKGEPCGRNSCSVPACVAARHAVAETSAPARHSVDDLADDPGAARVVDRPSGTARDCRAGSRPVPLRRCVDAFAQERARRHRARRPCKSTECTNPICVASRPTP